MFGNTYTLMCSYYVSLVLFSPMVVNEQQFIFKHIFYRMVKSN